MKRTVYNLLIVLLIVLGAAWTWTNRVVDAGAANQPLAPAPVKGHPAPDFAAATVDGTAFRLSEQRGRPVILNFWATWCPPCRAELPELQDASVRYAGEVVVVGVDQAEAAAVVSAFAAQMGPSFPLPLDTDGRVSRLYRVRSLPTTYFVDREGIVRASHIGPLTQATLRDLLRSVYP